MPAPAAREFFAVPDSHSLPAATLFPNSRSLALGLSMSLPHVDCQDSRLH